jgi:Carboxypeptidase regulatory-like domain/TonB dependent receptor
MNFRYYLAASVAGLSIATAIASPAAAQDTTSALRGTVEADGAPVADATVVIEHVPSGTSFTTTTDADGSFSANGLRVGGPFTVTVDASGYETSSVTDLNLQAGESFRLPITLQVTNDIVVTASSVGGALETSNGPITALGRTEIEGVATINRDIRDLARRDPLVTIDLSNSRTIEVAGNNGRLNRFSVDGVQFSDDFGLNNGGLPSNRGPVPIDAIEQFSVKVAPYDVSEGDFQGGAINVVLRSGGNRFRGSAFYSYTDDSLTGSNVRGTPVNLDFDSTQYGAHISGPIIRDTLFFALTYEKTTESDPFDNGVGTGFSAQVPGVTTAQIDNISAIAQSVYNYDTLGLTSNAQEEDEKFVAKLDWNITDGQRASFTYIRNIGTQQFQQNTSLSATTPSIGLLSNAYELTEEINSGVFQLNSQWSDDFSTEVRVSYRDYNRGQTPFGGNEFGQFAVCLDPTSAGSVTACTPGVARVFFGPDVFRHSNALNQENLSADFTARLEAGDHSFKFLAGYTDISTFNLFVPRSLGEFYFDSVADFQARRASSLSLANAVPSLDPNDGAAEFSTQAWTVGIQDDWQVTDNLVVTAGVRYDLYNNPIAPILNSNFLARQGFSNRATFSGRGAFQPRFGFNWEATDRIVVRGGVGIFAGGTPDVFLSNSFSNTGQLTNQINLLRNTSAAGCNVTDPAAAAICAGGLIGVDGRTFNGSVTDFLARNTASLALAPVNLIDPDLDIAKKLRGSLGIDYDADLGFLGDGWLFGAQILYDETINAYQWTDLRSRALGRLPDGRTRYNALNAGDNNQDLLLTNSDDGRAIIGSIRFEKRFDFGLTIDGSYTRSDVTDANALTSSTASSLYSNNAFLDPNFAATGTSIYQIRDQYKFSLDFRRAFFGDYETRFSLFGEYRSGRPYSITVGDLAGGRSPVFGTNGNNGRFLAYIPNLNDPLVSFDSAASETAFNAIVASEGLGQYRGRIIPKNTQQSPDFFRVDLHVEQEIPAFVGSARFKLFADIENVLNLIDSDWGALRQVGFPQTAQIASVQCLSVATATGTAPAAGVVATAPTGACVQYRYSGVRAPILGTVTRQSLYGIRVGVKFEF